MKAGLLLGIGSLLFLGFLSSPVQAGEEWAGIQVSRDSSGALILSAPCEKITSMILALAQWKSRLGEEPGEASLLASGPGTCEIGIDNVTPSKINALEGTSPRHDGPNCWDTSLFFDGVVLTRRAVSSEEMSLWISSPLCRPLADNEAPVPGDLIAIRSQASGGITEMHGFTYLTDDLSFSKSGYAADFPYELVSTDYVFELFALGKNVANPKCRRVTGVPADCLVFANYFRCQSYRAYLESSSFPGKSEFEAFDRRLTVYENALSPVVTKGDPEPEFLTGLGQQLDSLKRQAESGLSASGNFLWKTGLARIDSMEEQIELLKQGW